MHSTRLHAVPKAAPHSDIIHRHALRHALDVAVQSTGQINQNSTCLAWPVPAAAFRFGHLRSARSSLYSHWDTNDRLTPQIRKAICHIPYTGESRSPNAKLGAATRASMACMPVAAHAAERTHLLQQRSTA